MEWKPIPGYEKYLEVSDEGQVRTIDRYVRNRWGGYKLIPSRILKATPNYSGYLHASVRLGGKTVSIRISRAVAMAFIPNPFNKEQVDHIDCDKSNNRVSNLRWATPKENVMYADQNGLRDHNYSAFIEKTRDPQFQANALELAARVHRKKTYCFTLNGEFVKEYESCNEAARENCCSVSGVSACCRGVLPSLKGKIYSYERNRFPSPCGGANAT